MAYFIQREANRESVIFGGGTLILEVRTINELSDTLYYVEGLHPVNTLSADKHIVLLCVDLILCCVL